MDTNSKIGKIEAIALIVIVITSQIVLNLPNTILKQTGNSVLLNTVYISIIAVSFCLFICKLYKPFQHKDILEISEYLGGKFLKNIVGILYMIFFLIIASTLVRYFSNSLKLVYFNNTPTIFIIMLFLIPPVVINKIGFRAVSRANLIFIPAFLISLLVVVLSVFNNFNPQNLFPILGYGAKETFIFGAANVCAFSSIGYLYFLPPLLKNLKDFKQVTIISTVISAIYLILTSTCTLMLFSFITKTDEMLSSYLIARLIEYGNFLQRVDAIFIFIWILGTLSYLSVTFFYILNIFKKVTNIKQEKEMVSTLASISFAIALIPSDIADIEFIEKTIYKYFVLILVFGISGLILLLSYLKSKKTGES